jgi:hypothetical protein
VRAELTGLRLADPPARWAALGFCVGDSGFALGGVEIELGKPGSGIVGWTLTGIDPTGEIDGLPTAVPGTNRPPPVDHENGAVAVDHVVVMTANFDRTAAALEHAGMPLRRTITSPSGNRMGFRRLGPAILELVEGSDDDGGRARFWGLVVIVEDLEALAARLGDRLGSIRDAVQPGRRIATVRESAGLGQPMAFMSPELRSAKT